ncbi:MAG: hypothetical protein R2724_26415 [Bryobacterales bacterium]
MGGKPVFPGGGATTRRSMRSKPADALRFFEVEAPASMSHSSNQA